MELFYMSCHLLELSYMELSFIRALLWSCTLCMSSVELPILKLSSMTRSLWSYILYKAFMKRSLNELIMKLSLIELSFMELSVLKLSFMGLYIREQSPMLYNPCALQFCTHNCNYHSLMLIVSQ